MRPIHVDDDLKLRFPGRDECFNEGVEIGLALAAMAAGRPAFDLRVSATTLEQARDLADKMGYRVIVGRLDDSWAEITCCTGQFRPRLTVVSSSPALAAHASAG